MIIRKRCKWGDNLYMIAIFRIMVVIFRIGRSNCFTIKNFILGGGGGGGGSVYKAATEVLSADDDITVTP